MLLIDDDEATNYINQTFIRKSGHCEEITAIEDAEKALNYLESVNESSRPSVILLDINMPRMNGWEFLDAYMELPEDKIKGIQIYMLTTSMNPNDQNKMETHQLLNGFFHKPLTFEIIEKIKNNLDN